MIAGLHLWRYLTRPPASEAPATHVTLDDEQERLAHAVDSGRRALLAGTDARAAVIACYAAMEKSLADSGVIRRVSDSPQDLLERAVAGGLPTGAVAAVLTALFREAPLASRSGDAPSGTRSGDGRHRPHSTRAMLQGIGPPRPDQAHEGVTEPAHPSRNVHTMHAAGRGHSERGRPAHPTPFGMRAVPGVPRRRLGRTPAKSRAGRSPPGAHRARPASGGVTHARRPGRAHRATARHGGLIPYLSPPPVCRPARPAPRRAGRGPAAHRRWPPVHPRRGRRWRHPYGVHELRSRRRAVRVLHR